MQSNWPHNTNLGGANWTGRVARSITRYNYVCPEISWWRAFLARWL